MFCWTSRSKFNPALCCGPRGSQAEWYFFPVKIRLLRTIRKETIWTAQCLIMDDGGDVEITVNKQIKHTSPLLHSTSSRY